MPAAIQGDWELIRQLYISGKGPSEIADITGVKPAVISVRASRERWKAIAERTNAQLGKISLASGNAQGIDPEATALSTASLKVRKAMAKSLERLTELLEREKPKDFLTAAKLQSRLEPAVRNAKTVLSWSDSASQPAVRINVLSGLTLSVSQPTDPSAQSVTEPSTKPVLEAEVVGETKASFSQGPTEPKPTPEPL